jgi:hypothetical protein
VFTFKRCLLLFGLSLLVGCQSTPSADDPVKPSGFELRNVVKGDTDLVAEISVRQARDYLRELARKLYLRNPNQLLRAGRTELDVPHAVDRLFATPAVVPQLQGKRSADAILLAFDESFEGDRVAAFIYGLRSMTADAYGGEGEFYLSNEYDAQKLYYLARNVEIADWRLRSKRDVEGRLFLQSSIADGDVNLSFERLFGKLIGLHDQFAQVVADINDRRIKNVIQGVASAVFFPI